MKRERESGSSTRTHERKGYSSEEDEFRFSGLGQGLGFRRQKYF